MDRFRVVGPNRLAGRIRAAGAKNAALPALAATLLASEPVVLRGVKYCDRCPITTTDQRTGARDPRQEPLRTLATYRHDYKLKGVIFGQNCVIEAGVGERLAVGSELAIG